MTMIIPGTTAAGPAEGSRATPARIVRECEGGVVSAALQIDHLSKAYRTTRAVDGLDLRVEKGEIVGLLGPNGSGKTTTMECAYGLRKADSGTIRVFGVDSRAEPDRVARLVGTQLQDSALPDRIKMWEALHLFAALAGKPVNEAEALLRWGLTGKRRAGFGSLSGGQRQRLLVALALVAHLRLVIPRQDDQWSRPERPTGGLDLVEEVRRRGTTEVRGRGAFLVALGHALTLAGLSTVSLDVTSPSLEDVYVRLLEEAEP
jgi:ABC-2 type transport system ATP-binding protein